MNQEKNKFISSFTQTIFVSLMVMMSHISMAESPTEFSPVDGETELASLSRDSELMEKPETGSKTVAKLKAKTEVQVLNRSGAWAEVITDKQEQGFVRLLNLRTSGQARGNSGINTLVKSFRTGSSGQSVATGVKGMSSEELNSSKVDEEQVKQLASLKADSKQAQNEAKANGLKTKDVPELPNKEK